MLLDFAAPFKRLGASLWRQPLCPPQAPQPTCPLIHPDLPLPAWVANDPLVQKYRALIGDLPWSEFPERPTDRPWPGPSPDPRAPFVAAFLVKLHEGKRFMSELRQFLGEHPALLYYLGFARVPDVSSPYGFDVAATLPKRRHLSTVLRELPNPSLQWLLSASVELLKATLPPEQQALFGDTIAGDTQALLAWVRENNPKQYIQEGRLDKNRQPKADPDCKLGVKKARNTAPADADGAADPPAPTTDAKPARDIQLGVDIFWGYASGIVVSRLPDGTEVVLAERTRPFNHSDASYFFPLMQQVEQRLGRKPRFGAWDCAFDAHYVYEYFHQAGGFAAVPFNPGRKGGKRQFDPDGRPLCAAGLPMPQLLTYLDRTSGLLPHRREKCGCPLLTPQPNGQPCPIDDAHFAKGGCTTTLAADVGARIRHTLDREGQAYKYLYAQRTMVERVNSQAEALGMLHPKLRRGRAIANQNSLTYVLINLRALQRIRAAQEGRPSTRTTSLAA
ncbi:hypothetical protein SE17_24910 [Kouleothrix aurantiaca]|uniref:Transposase DDE domain-containing protein n=1 Tax=Kouleothrix aurantiaca TaxID=186479 RepID=A0A0P9FD83_9CHLR|nr:hypothetical protein SE17_24910 [Kouleothrix aurantiaca]